VRETAAQTARELVTKHEPPPLPTGVLQELRGIIAEAEERAGVS
jgi:hypothetical protein